MKRNYRYHDGESFQADLEDLKKALETNKLYLQNYLEVEEDLEDPSYVARGNGFCDAKFSEDFIEGQIAKYQGRMADLTRWISELEQ